MIISRVSIMVNFLQGFITAALSRNGKRLGQGGGREKKSALFLQTKTTFKNDNVCDNVILPGGQLNMNAKCWSISRKVTQNNVSDSRIHIIIDRFSINTVMQSDGNSFCGNVVLDSFVMEYNDEDSILDEKYEKQIFW